MFMGTNDWDIRGEDSLRKMFPRHKRRGYWYKVTRKQAQEIVNELANVYNITTPYITDRSPSKGTNGEYCLGSISIWPRAHLRTVFHEFYHHLDRRTNGYYNSSDTKGYSWEFANKLWEAFRKN